MASVGEVSRPAGGRPLARAAATAAAATAAVPWALLGLVVLGFLVRLAVAGRLPPHVDEGNMVLGIRTVAERGWPLLPSGVLYIHGATVSYLLAPLAWLGWANFLNLFPLRVASALCGALAVWLTFRLARRVAGAGFPALLAAALVAVDPLNVLWGGFVRMYALLQVLALLVAWFFIRAVETEEDEPAGDRSRFWTLAGLVVAFWLAVFTQVVAAMLLPALAVAAVAICGRRLLGAKRGVGVALALCAAAPVAFVFLSSRVGQGSTTVRAGQESALPSGGFLGDDALDFSRLAHPDPRAIQSLFASGLLDTLVPVVVTLLVGLAVGRFLLGGRGPGDRVDRDGLGTLFLLFWTPLLLFAFVVSEQKARYLLDVLPFGYVLVAAGVWALVRPSTQYSVLSTQPRLSLSTEYSVLSTRRSAWPARVAAVGVVLLLLVRDASGLWTLGEWGVEQTQPGYQQALGYVVARRAPGEWTVVGSTPEAYLVLGNQQPIVGYGGILARPGPTPGAKVDDWIGWRVLDSNADVCALLTDHPGTWVVLGAQRLDPDKPSTAIFEGASDDLLRTPDGFRVLHSRPPAAWESSAVQGCARA